MKKRTFKSASGSRRTSSPSGGSAKTAGTAKTTTNMDVHAGKYVAAVKKLNGMSAAEFRQTLVRLGINEPNGDLTKKYSTKKRSAETKSGIFQDGKYCF